MSGLYELTGDFLNIQNMLEEEEFDKEALLNTLEGIDYAIDIKAENYGKVIKNLEAVKAGIKGQRDALKNALSDEINRLSDKEKTIDNKIKYMKENLGQAMRATGKEKIKTELFSFYFKRNQAVNIINEAEALNSGYVRVKKEIDKVKLLEDMKKGGKFDFANIKESESLIIR